MSVFLMDTNILIRVVTAGSSENDENSIDSSHEFFSKKVFEGVEKGEITLVISPLVLAESCWVLEGKRYKRSKPEIAKVLLYLIDSKGIKCMDKEITVKALEYYGEKNIDFTAAWLAALSEAKSLQVLSWNTKDFRRTGCEYYDPKQIIGET
ncbi:PIN domain-containing protein [Bacillaceae bacterium Marseille-Q3522]|nr:PIN domain-containing protein [Bacillaceae bacterium Marseille-Q3522]